MQRAWLLAACALPALSLSALSAPAIAQGVASGAPAAPAGSAASPAALTTGLSEIVVTAQRRSENLQRAAVAVSAVTGAGLVSAGVTQPAELTNVVPALQVAPAAGPYALFYLRGVGNFNGNALSDAAVAFNFDGVYVGRPSGTTGFFYDLDRVEVLKGPQGTLYGRNATGGAVNVISRRPQLNTYGGDVSFEYGNYNSINAEGALNIPIGDTMAVRLALTHVSHDGYMKDGTDDQDDTGGRLSFRAEPTDKLSINVVVDAFKQTGRGQGATPIESGVDNRYGFLSPQGQAFISAQPNLVLGRTFAPYTAQPFENNNFFGVSSTIDYRTPVGTLTLIPAYREGRLNYRSDGAGFYLQEREQDKQGSFEVRLDSGNDHPLRYLLGGFYYNEMDDVPYFYVNQQSNLNYDVYKQHDESGAIFGRLTYAITPDIRLTAGGRYTTEHKELNGTLDGDVRTCALPTAFFPAYAPGCPGAQAFPVDPTNLPTPNFNPFAPGANGALTIPVFVDNSGANAKRANFDKFTYRFSADWDVTPRNLLYASYETGFKSGGFYFTSDNGVYRPETIEAYTVGSKNRFFSNRLQLNLEGFYWKYSDQQITHLINDSAGQTVFGTTNVGRATYYGVEGDTRFLLTPTTELTGDVQYLHARYDSFVYLTPNQNGGQGNGTSCANVGTPGASYTVDCSGKQPPYAPTWTLNLGGQQTFDLPNGGRIIAAVNGHYQTRTLTGLEFTAPEYQNAYWQLDSQLSYKLPGRPITLTGFVRNATDETVKGNSFPVPFSLVTAATLRPPRTYGFRVNASF